MLDVSTGSTDLGTSLSPFLQVGIALKIWHANWISVIPMTGPGRILQVYVASLDLLLRLYHEKIRASLFLLYAQLIDIQFTKELAPTPVYG